MRRALIGTFAIVLLSSPANADTASCAATLEDARALDARGKPKEALGAMDACIDCDALADVCAATRAALRSAVPTVTVTVQDERGLPLTEAVVLVDGAPHAQNESIDLDPGPHTIRANLEGHADQQTLVVAEHETHHAWLTLARPPSRRTPASVIGIGAGSGLAFATAAGLWAWSQTISAPSLLQPNALQSYERGWQHTRDDLLAASAVALSSAVIGTVIAIVLYATRR